ncbi:mercury resistance system periplasmic binding protein MerP [Ectothiorhodospiraceae bacterium WFHF3C12]|nr:mercury resistance system periplasmic binding protein MerP [Ectothiorhodospiraceae bacterium WFHF3C12]
MVFKRFSLATLMALALLAPAFAAERTVTLDVENMTCASCPYIVEKSLTRVSGVTATAVSFDEKTATVTFDDAVTSIDALTRATAAAGYPSSVRD